MSIALPRSNTGAVATGAPLSAQISANILQCGGNAADAAVAGTLAAVVAEGVYTNLFAGALIMIREPSGTVRVLDAFAAMPGLGTPWPNPNDIDFREKRLSYGETVLRFHVGRGSTAVPGLPAGLAALHAGWGSLPLTELVAPAVALAREGVVWPPHHRALVRVLEPILTDTPGNHALVAPYVEDHTAERPVYMPLMANLLEQLGAAGLESFYHGPIADAICDDQRSNGGLLTQTDLSEYRVLESPPLRLRLRGWDLWLPRPPSLGGTLVAAMLALWAEVSEVAGAPPPGSAAAAHRWAVVIDVVNGARAVFEDAARNKEPLAPLVAALLPATADLALQPRARSPAPDPRLAGGTTHLSAVDEQGLAVAISSSAGESGGYVVPGLGTMANNMLGEADLHHEGFHSATAGTRLTTMMAPMLLARGDHRRPRELVAMGSGGSLRIRTALAQTAWWLCADGVDLQTAIERPRRHFEEGRLHMEAARGTDGVEQSVTELAAMGYDVVAWPGLSSFFGGVNAARRHVRRGAIRPSWEAHGDSRRDGAGATV